MANPWNSSGLVSLGEGARLVEGGLREKLKEFRVDTVKTYIDVSSPREMRYGVEWGKKGVIGNTSHEGGDAAD